MTGLKRRRLTFGLAAALIFSNAASAVPLLTTSQAGDLIFEVLRGEGATSTQEFGFGTPSTGSSIAERDVIFVIELNGGVSSVAPSPVVNAGYFTAGSSLDFYNVSNFGGTFFAFSSALGGSPTPSDLVVFADADNSLGFGGSIVETIGVDNWILHMDDAASICCDDDDNEIVIQVWVDHSAEPPVSVAEPASIAVFALGLITLGAARRRRTRVHRETVATRHSGGVFDAI